MLLLPALSTVAQPWHYTKVFTTDFNLRQRANRYDTLDLKGAFLPIKQIDDYLIINKDTLRITRFSITTDTLTRFEYNADSTDVIPLTYTMDIISMDVKNKKGDTGTAIKFGDVMFLDYLLNKNYRRVMEFRLVVKQESVSDKRY